MSAPLPASLVNIVLDTSIRLLRDSVGVDARLGEMTVVQEMPPAPHIWVQMELLGDKLGPLTWTFEPKIAQAIAARLLAAEAPPPFVSEETADAVAELSNVICGHAAAALAGAGFEVELSPPKATVRMRSDALVLPEKSLGLQVRTALGDIHVLISPKTP